MNNLDIRQEAKTAGVKLWQIADMMGLQDSNFSKLLRRELSPEEKTKIRSIIANLKHGTNLKQEGNKSNRLTRREACEFLGCGYTKLYELEKSGKLEGTYYQIGKKRLYITEKLEEWALSGGDCQ